MNAKITTKLDNFFASYNVRSYRKGQTLVWADEAPPGVIYLVQGSVAQYDVSLTGQKVVLNVFKPGAFFPMNWVLNDMPNAYNFEALEDVSCRIAPPKNMIDFLQDNPDVTLDLMSRVYKGTDGLLRRIGELMSGTARSQLVLELAISALRFGTPGKNGEYVLKIKTTDLAERTGMARETVSRSLKRLEELGAIERKTGQIIIKDLPLIEAMDPRPRQD